MTLLANLGNLIGTVMGHARAIREIQQSLADAHAQIRDAARRSEYAIVHGKVTDVDPEKHLYRQEIAEVDEDGNPTKSPWLPYSQIAGTRKVHSAPSVGQQMTLLAPGGNIERAISIPLTWWNDNPSPSTSGSEDVDLRGKTRHTQKDGDFKTEIDGVTRQYTKQSAKLVIHKDPENEQEGQGEEVSDKKPWKGNRGKTKHSRLYSKDGGYTLIINEGDDSNEHKVTVHPDNAVEISTHKGKHKITVKKDGITSSVDNGKHTVEVKSSQLGGMAGGQVGQALGATNTNNLATELMGLMHGGSLGGMLSGGGIGGLLGGQLGTLLGNALLSQLTSELSTLFDANQLGESVGGGIFHKSEVKVKIDAPKVLHKGDLKVEGSVRATQVIQSDIGLKGAVISGAPGDPGDAGNWSEN
jgi:phage baseplate assembly protein gpV